MSKDNSGLFEGTIGALDGSQIKLNTSLIDDNYNAIVAKYPINEFGQFGEKGKNSRIIYSKNPVNESAKFFDILSKGANIEMVKDNKVTLAYFSDGTVVSYRVVTKTKDSPAVQITIKGQSKFHSQKIHFMKED